MSAQMDAVLRTYKYIDAQLFEYLIETAPDVSDYVFYSAFQELCREGKLDHIKACLKHNLKCVPTSNGYVGLLYYAAMGDQYEIYKFLYESKIDTRIAESHIELAIENLNAELLRYILKNKELDKQYIIEWREFSKKKNSNSGILAIFEEALHA